jgi:hypothetical protein
MKTFSEKLKGNIGAIFFCIVSIQCVQSQIIINELLIRQSNVHLSFYENFDPVIEILNTTNSDLSLGEFYLSDDELNLHKWQFPNMSVAANAFVLVYLSGRNSAAPQIHANFKLSETEALYLSNSSSLLESIAPFTHPLNISYSRFPDAGDAFQFTTPTLGSTNVSGISSIPNSPLNLTQMGVLEPGSFVQFAQVNSETRYSSDGYEVKVSDPLLTQTISLPNPSTFPNRFSAVPSNPGLQFPLFDYTESRANNRGYAPPFGLVHKINVVRVKPFTTNLELEERVYTYFPETPSFNLPIISIVTDNANFFEDEEGIYVWGDTTDIGNYNQTGIDFERLCTLQFFDVNGTFIKEKKMGGRIHGNGSRHSPQKSLRFYNRPGIDDSDFFLPNGVKTDVILLRSGGHRPDCIGRDYLGCKIVEEMEMDHADPYLHAVYLNGEFWGLYDLRARIDADFIGERYNIENDFVGMIDHTYLLSEGTLLVPDEYEQLTLFAEENEMSEANFNYLAQRVDMPIYTDLFCTEIYFGNYDFPINNVGAWKYNTAGGNSKWRHYIFDLDGTFGGSCSGESNSNQTLNYYLHTNTTSMLKATRLLRNLLEYPEYQTYFINHMADLLNTQFSPSVAAPKFDNYRNAIASIQFPHLKRYRYPSNLATLAERISTDPDIIAWEDHLDGYEEYFEVRPGYVRTQFMNEFSLGNSISVVVNVNDQAMGKVQLNSLYISNVLIGANTFNTYPWTGVYFSNVPVELTAASKYGFKFDSWSMSTSTSPVLSYSSATDNNITANFSADPNFMVPVVNEIMASNSNVLQDDFGQHEDWIEIYNPNPYPITLEGYYLTDDLAVPNKFMVSSKSESIVPSNGYRIFYASNVTQRGADHTNFKISAGETVTLSAPNGTVLSSVAVPSWLVPNTSYGSSPNGSNSNWGMYATSTPGEENPSGVADIEEDISHLFKIYPNPTDEGVISFTAVGDYSVYDVQGRMLGVYYNVIKLNIEGLQSGVYLVVNEFGRSERLVKL